MISVLSLALFSQLVLARPSNKDGLLVETPHGTFRAMINSTAPHVREFLGIPFAQPPVGKLRWLAPQPLRNNRGEMSNATSYAPSCPQYMTTIPFIGNQVLPEVTINGPVSEDCLALNIFTPIQANDLPVLVFLPGGGFTTGGTNVNYQWPGHWVERTNRHIVVSLNYRLNIFGFPNAAGLHEQNLGVLDQRAGLEWVRDNIHAFGGDPSRITLTGQSAGGASADGHNFAYWKDPIYTGFFGMSGTVFIGALPKDEDHLNFTFVTEGVGCKNSTPAAQLECMRTVPHETITAFIQSHLDGVPLGSPNTLSFVPVPDEKIMFSNYTDRYAQGKVPYNVAGIDQASADQVTFGMFQCPAALSTGLRSALNLTTYRYLYSGNFSNVSPLPWLGAYHGSDVPILFGTHQDYTHDQGQSTKLEYETSEKLQDLLLALMQDPHHGPETLSWQPASIGTMLRFGGKRTAVQHIPTDVVDRACG